MTGEIRRRIAAILCLVMSLLFISSAALAEESGIKVLLDGSEISFDQPPVIENGRTLVPMRGIFEALGATVEWDGDTRTITGKKDGDVIIMQIGSGRFTKNGTEIPLDVPPKIISDRTLVPLRAIAESFEADVNWDGTTNTVTISVEGGSGISEAQFAKWESWAESAKNDMETCEEYAEVSVSMSQIFAESAKTSLEMLKSELMAAPDIFVYEDDDMTLLELCTDAIESVDEVINFSDTGFLSDSVYQTYVLTASAGCLTLCSAFNLISVGSLLEMLQ